MIIVTCRVYPKGVGPAYKTDKTYKEKSYTFDNSQQLKDFLNDSRLDVIVDKVFEIKEEVEQWKKERLNNSLQKKE